MTTATDTTLPETTTLLDSQARLWLWDPALHSWVCDDDGVQLRGTEQLAEEFGPLTVPDCTTCGDRGEIRDRSAVPPSALTAPCPDCTDEVDEAPAEGPRHADTVPVPVEVHAREDEQERKAS